MKLSPRVFSVVRNYSQFADDMQTYGIKALMLDARLKDQPEANQIKCFRLFRMRIRRIDASNPNQRNSYDVDWHYTPPQDGYSKTGLIFPVIKSGSKIVSYWQVGIDEFELQMLMMEFLKGLSQYPYRRDVENVIQAAIVHHKGNWNQEKDNPYFYEVSEKQISFVRNFIISLINRVGRMNERSAPPQELNIGLAIKTKIEFMANLFPEENGGLSNFNDLASDSY